MKKLISALAASFFIFSSSVFAYEFVPENLTTEQQEAAKQFLDKHPDWLAQAKELAKKDNSTLEAVKIKVDPTGEKFIFSFFSDPSKTSPTRSETSLQSPAGLIFAITIMVSKVMEEHRQQSQPQEKVIAS